MSLSPSLSFFRTATAAAAHAAHVASAAVVTLCALPLHAHADTVWHWSYNGNGISASGTLTAGDARDADGFHQITAITGLRNGQAVTGLYPTGSAIPGNEPYALDNLIRLDGGAGQLSTHGLGFALDGGGYVNPFYADFLPTPGYLEVFTTAGGGFSEVPVTFTAAPVPEPSALALMLAGLGVIALRRARG